MRKFDSDVLASIAGLTQGCCTPALQFEAWQTIFEAYRPTRYLEVGSFKGRSLFLASFLSNEYCSDSVDHLFTSIDSWEGGDEHKQESVDMPSAEACFDAVLSLCRKSIAPGGSKFEKIKSLSRQGLIDLQSRVGIYDLIYVDASHRSKDVLVDAFLRPLLRDGGIMIFDDYT